MQSQLKYTSLLLIFNQILHCYYYTLEICVKEKHIQFPWLPLVSLIARVKWCLFKNISSLTVLIGIQITVNEHLTKTKYFAQFSQLTSVCIGDPEINGWDGRISVITVVLQMCSLFLPCLLHDRHYRRWGSNKSTQAYQACKNHMTLKIYYPCNGVCSRVNISIPS